MSLSCNTLTASAVAYSLVGACNPQAEPARVEEAPPSAVRSTPNLSGGDQEDEAMGAEAIALPRYRGEFGAINSIAVEGLLSLVDGCLVFGDASNATLIVWPSEAALDLTTEPGIVRVRLGAATVRVGDRITMGGQGGSLDRPPLPLVEAIPSQCPRRLWFGKDIGPATNDRGTITRR